MNLYSYWCSLNLIILYALPFIENFPVVPYNLKIVN